MLLSGRQWQSLLPLLLFSNLLLSQEISPYSRFALGEVRTSSFAAPKGMGKLASGYRDPLYINFINPASYSSLALTTLETGFSFSTKNITDGQTQQSYRTGDGFFDYLAFGFPAGRSVGTSFGIVPYSEMNYKFQTSKDDDTLSITRQFEGSGRIYQIYAGAAYRYPKSDTSDNTFSLGLNFAYVFGNREANDNMNFSETGFYNIRIASSARVSNLALNAGFQYRKKLNDSLAITIGAYSLFPVANYSSDTIWEVRIVRTVPVDTLHKNGVDNGNIKIPVDIGLGATIGNPGKWMAGLDIKYSLWNDVEPFSDEAALKNSVAAGIGGEFRPNFKSQNLFKNSTYRLGAFYNSGNLQIDGERIMDYGFTFGWSVPIKTQYSRLNFSFDVGKNGTTRNGLVSETFFRAYIGLTLNDKWFIRPKYD